MKNEPERERTSSDLDAGAAVKGCAELTKEMSRNWSHNSKPTYGRVLGERGSILENFFRQNSAQGQNLGKDRNV